MAKEGPQSCWRTHGASAQPSGPNDSLRLLCVIMALLSLLGLLTKGTHLVVLSCVIEWQSAAGVKLALLMQI